MLPYTGVIIDTEPPHLQIISPKANTLYVLNTELCPFVVTLIIGKITVLTNATDNIGINRVEFYIDDRLQDTISTPPYQWEWNQRMFWKHSLTVIVYDDAELSTSAECKVWKFF